MITSNHPPLDDPVQKAEPNSRNPPWLSLPEFLGNESRGSINFIRGTSKALLDETITSPLNAQQKERIRQIYKLIQTLEGEIEASIDTANEIRQQRNQD
jgi:hypothetical protein